MSLVEATISIVVVSVLLVAALDTVGGATMTQVKATDRTLGHLLAQDLMSEILQQEYEQPDRRDMLITTVFGIETGQDLGTRAAFDDVDDYDEWSASPPQEKDGTEIPNLEGWSRTVTIDWVDADDLTNTRVIETGVKAITVVVTSHDVPVASLTAVRTGSVQPLVVGPRKDFEIELVTLERY